MTDELMTAFANVTESGLALVKAVRHLAAHVQPRQGGAAHLAELEGIAEALSVHEDRLQAASKSINRHR